MIKTIFVLLLITALASFLSGCDGNEQIDAISKTPTPLTSETSTPMESEDYDSPIDVYVSPASGGVKIGIDLGGGMYLPLDGGGLEWGFGIGD